MDLKEMKAKHPIPFKLEAKPDNDKTVVYLYGDIVDETPVDWWTGEPLEGDWITPKGVRDLFESVEGNDIDLHLNSYGGSVFASVAIKNYLEGLGKNITVYVDAIAASGGSVIAMAGKTVKMYPNAMLMIHRAWTYAAGNAKDLRKEAEFLEKVDRALLENYSTRYTGEQAELEALIDNETWLTADEAKEIGLCDDVIREPKKDEKLNKTSDMIAAFVDAAFFNLKK